MATQVSAPTQTPSSKSAMSDTISVSSDGRTAVDIEKLFEKAQIKNMMQRIESRLQEEQRTRRERDAQ